VQQLVEPHGPVSPESASRAILQKMARSWHQRAQVRKAPVQDDATFDPSRPDFSVDLLPFKDHPRFLQLDERQREATLSSAWLVYNSKTLDIETCIVSPLCQDVLAGRLPGLTDPVSRQIISETLVDESYHVLLTVNATNLTRQARGLQVDIPPSLLLRLTRECQEQYTEEWQRTLVRFAVAVVSEVFISDYLLLLSSSDEIQPLHRLAVEAHRRDEAAHGVVFRHLAKVLYGALSKREQEFFAAVLPRPVRWFAAQDLGVWAPLFRQLGIADTDGLLHDCRQQHAGKLGNIDYTGVVRLAQELGITDMSIGRNAFQSEGLLA
jgi:alpha-N-dichloroacetyl-p-aminophenylserinol N-oxygenase